MAVLYVLPRPWAHPITIANWHMIAYHTGAGLGDAVLGSDKSLAMEAYYNKTDSQQYFTYEGNEIGGWPLAVQYGPYQCQSNGPRTQMPANVPQLSKRSQYLSPVIPTRLASYSIPRAFNGRKLNSLAGSPATGGMAPPSSSQSLITTTVVFLRPAPRLI